MCCFSCVWPCEAVWRILVTTFRCGDVWLPVLRAANVSVVCFSCTMPSAPSHVADGSARVPLWAADHAAREKKRKYKELAAREHRQLYPFVMEAYGGMVDSARALLKRMSDHAADKTGAGQFQRSEILTHMHAALAIALVRGNARHTAAVIRMAAHATRSNARPILVVRKRGREVARRAPRV